MVKVVSQFGLSRAHVVDEGSCVASGGRLISHIDKMQQTDKSGFPRLFYSSLIDAKDDIEDRLDKARTILQRLVGVGSEREAHDALQNAVCRDKSTHDDISLGLLANILTDANSAQKCFRDLTFVTRDNMAVVVDTLVIIATDKYQKLTDVSRSQLIWVVKELVRASMVSADLLCWSVLRQIAGGDITNRNLWLAENMLETLVENRTWLEKFPVLIGSVIFTYLRILEDHFPSHLSNLRQKEVNFVVSLIRDHFASVIMNPVLGMGRDFVRLLQGVSRIPEIQGVWVDLFYNPKSISPHFTGVSQLLNIRTSRKFLQSRLTPEMEKKIFFLTNNTKFGMHKRYQEWFQHKFLATQESQTLRADIIRFIVGVIHPPNEILCSDILPRWAVIGWLLTTCTSPVAAANAKLALFFDWLIFDPVKDNIMNIEPGILVMHHSIRPHLAITATLIDFLIRQITEFWPDGSDKIKEGIGSAFRTILEKKVLQSLDPVLDNPKLEPELRNSIQDVLIPLFKRGDSGDPNQQLGNNGNGVIGGEIRTGDVAESLSLNYSDSESSRLENNSNNEVNHISKVKSEPQQQPSYSVPIVDLEFSDDDDDNDNDDQEDNEKDEDDPIGIKPILSSGLLSRGSPTTSVSVEEAERSKIFDLVQTLPTNLRIPLESMLSNPTSDKTDNLDEVLEECSSVQIEKEQREAVVKALIYIYKSELLSPCVNEEENSLIDDNVCASPVIEILQPLLQSKPSDKTLKSKNLLRILTDIVHAVPRIGYKILLILNQLADNPDGPAGKDEYYPTLYKNLCIFRGIKLEQALNHDVKTCWETEPVAVGFLCPIIYDWYSAESVGSTDILRLVVSTIDSSQLQDIVWRVAQGDFIMLDTPDMLNTITKTLEWETWEQHCVWTILAAHQFEIDDYLPVIPILDYKNNAEALTALFLKLKSEKPSDKILGPCLCRKPNSKDRFIMALLICWSENEKDSLAEVLTALLVKAYGSPVKRKRGVTGAGRGTSSPAAGPATPNIEYVLAHLDLLRVQIEDGGVFNTDTMQAALLQVQSWVTDTQRNKYKDLLALAAIEESSEIKESRSVVKRPATGRKLPGSPTSAGSGTTGSNSGGGSSATSSGGGGTSGNSTSGGGSSTTGARSNSNLSRTRSGRTRQTMKDDSDSSSNDDDDEIIPQPRNAKKRRKTTAFNSDSD